jgi:hypothetical protein
VGCIECAGTGGVCLDVRHRLTPVSDDLLPVPILRSQSRARLVANVAVVTGGLALAGGAAYGVVPGELGHHGAKVLQVGASSDQSPEQTLADAYQPSHEGVGGGFAARGSRSDPHVVYVDGATESDGPAIVSAAFPAPNVSVLASRGNDGSCTFLRGDSRTTLVTTVRRGPCKANTPPRRGWKRFIARKPTR